MKPLPLSHSSLDRFKTCPKQFFELKVAKSVQDSKGDAAAWGDYVHKNFEDYLKARGMITLPQNLEQYREYLDTILAQDGTLYVEHELAVNARLQQCAFDASNVFIRGYADVLRLKQTRAWILDHKTGKRKPDSKQMKLMALLTFLIYPDVDRIRVAFAWLKTKQHDAEEFRRSQMIDLWNEFLPDIKAFLDAFVNDVWQPRQSGLCHGWCPVTQCEYWKPKRLR